MEHCRQGWRIWLAFEELLHTIPWHIPGASELRHREVACLLLASFMPDDGAMKSDLAPDLQWLTSIRNCDHFPDSEFRRSRVNCAEGASLLAATQLALESTGARRETALVRGNGEVRVLHL